MKHMAAKAERARCRGRAPLRGTTLIEVLMATMVSTLVAASVASLMSLLGGAIDEQDRMAQQIVRTAGGQARLSDHILRSRAILGQSTTQLVLWVPSEDFIASNQFKNAYDEINACEIRWYRWNSITKRLEMSRTTNAADMTVYALATDWNQLFSTLFTANALQTITVFDGLSSATFPDNGFTSCHPTRVSLDLAFDAASGGQTLRLSEAVPFLQKHKDCP